MRDYDERRLAARQVLNEKHPYLIGASEKEMIVIAFHDYRLDRDSQLSQDVRAFTKEWGVRE